MIEIFLVVTWLNNVPKVDAFKTVQEACLAAEGAGSAHLYKETVNRQDKVEIKEGTCQPLKQFIDVK